MKLKLTKTVKTGIALLTAIGVSGLTALTIVSCSSAPQEWVDPDKNWTWEKYASGEYQGIKYGIPGLFRTNMDKNGWLEKTEILLDDWKRDYPDVQYIVADTFSYQYFPNLEYVEIPETIRYIGNRAFWSNDSAPNHLSRGS